MQQPDGLSASSQVNWEVSWIAPGTSSRVGVWVDHSLAL
jgi:hypothetical protein